MGFLGTNSRNNWPISREFSEQTSRKAIGKNGQFCGYFQGKLARNQSLLC